MFGDVKFICLGGTPKRMLQFALYIKTIIGYKLPTGLLFENITASTDRYTMYKIGPVLSVNVSPPYHIPYYLEYIAIAPLIIISTAQWHVALCE